MKQTNQLTEGTKLIYRGKGFEGFQQNQPYMEFLGYDSNGWRDLWVEYNGKRLCITTNDVEIDQ